MKRVAVEDSLTGVRTLLERNGYEVVSLAGGKRADAVVVTGLDNNVMNMQDMAIGVPVIDASGKTPEEILESLRNYR
ncbi:MAG: YkuS family protein [Desulfotomaculales bacterium]